MKTVPTSPWLFPEEQAEVIQRLYELGLLKFDNARSLPLKSGGMTDVYINLRNARSDPEALRFVSELFAIPLRRLGVDQFVEVPDSVSCFAGPVSISTGIPYLTIREQEKEGRVSSAKVIGNPVSGQSVCIMDDVITNGQSKVVPHQKCVELGLDNRALVVLVDRQQGWQGNLGKQGVDLPVWAGMTLHDVRRHLIQTLGVMQRCDQEVEDKNPIIVALDGKDWESILPIIDQLRTTGCILKVNDLLFAEGIKRLLPNLSVYGRVMADLKGHDIPNTVANTCRRLRGCPPWAVTVHGSGGPKMVQSAVEVLAGTNTKVLAVTVLTSIDPETCEEIYVRQPMDQVMNLAKMALGAGAHGLVCSPQEVRELRNELGLGFTIVTPGVRSHGVDSHDQSRTDTPAAAFENGANYLVIGRQILGAADPVAEVRRILIEELRVM